MCSSLCLKGILLVALFFQTLNLLLVIGNVISNPNYQLSVWQYLFALTTATTSLALLVINLISKKELVMLFFDVKEGTTKESNKIN